MSPTFRPCPLQASLICVLVSAVPMLAAEDTVPASSSAASTQPTTFKDYGLEQLMDLEVTSVTRSPEKLSETASAIQVISGEDIQHSGASTLPEALRLAPNLQVAQVNASQWAIELIADSFTTASTLPWAVVASGGSSNPSSSSTSWPALTSSGLADQLYWGASEEESEATSSPTPGFTTGVTANGNCFVYDGGLVPSTTYAPTCGESPADVSTAVGVIFSAGTATGGGGGSGGSAVTITGTNFAAGDTVAFGGSAATGVTVNSATSITANAPAGNAQKVGGTVDVTVTGPGGTSPTSPADEFTYLVTSSTYSITLAASTTAPAVGGSVTLTATANKDIGPTPYGMSIVDASTGVVLSHVGSGSTFSVTVSQTSAMTQRYVAEIDNSGGVNIQANSSPVIVTWS